MSIISVVSTIVGQMNSNSLTYRFFHGEKDWQNLHADEDAFPAIYLDQPIRNNYEITKSGYIGEVYPLSIFILFKSEADWTPEEHEANCISKARLAAREFISMAQNSALVDLISDVDGLEFINLFDVNVSGLIMSLKIKPNIEASVCI